MFVFLPTEVIGCGKARGRNRERYHVHADKIHTRVRMRGNVYSIRREICKNKYACIQQVHLLRLEPNSLAAAATLPSDDSSSVAAVPGGVYALRNRISVFGRDALVNCPTSLRSRMVVS